uniref:VQ domain-containing protein n=1 Tax=Oryza meridionalis TaxID=40149 RepID=A0A1V1H5K2_9ORYZ|nr:hypothetical protein [Oryza meridionalis]
MGSRPDQGGGGGAVKVTRIVTARVNADEASFRDVVQRLTGKDSAAARAAAVAGNGLLLVGGDAVVFDGTVAGGLLPSPDAVAGDEAVVGHVYDFIF